jgi:acetyl-CoA carboxylase biotin carboxyl carrier protein
MEVDIEQIKKLVKLVEKHQLGELTVEEEGFSLTIKGPEAASPSVPVMMSPAPAHEIHVTAIHEEGHVEAAEEEVEESVDDGLHRQIGSPMVGVFYRAPSPDAPSYIEVGDTIEVGQTIGLIEAMKVFSEIPSEVAGEVVELPVANGKLVQQGEPLVIVKVKE